MQEINNDILSESESEDELPVIKPLSIATNIHVEKKILLSESDSEEEVPIKKPTVTVKAKIITKKQIDSSSESDDSEEEVKPVKKIIKKATKKIASIELNSDSENELVKKKQNVVIKKTLKKEPQEISVTKKDWLNEQVNITEKDSVEVSEKFAKYFSYDKEIKLTLLSFKKLLLNYLNKKKLIKKDSFDIELPDDLCDAISFDTKLYNKVFDFRKSEEFCKFVLDKMSSSTKNTTEKKN